MSTAAAATHAPRQGMIGNLPLSNLTTLSAVHFSSTYPDNYGLLHACAPCAFE